MFYDSAKMVMNMYNVWNDGNPDVVATALLVKARIDLSADACAQYEAITPAPNAHHIAVVAARELAALRAK